ncbi:alpha/beta hydrolase [Shewanella inventionis]|uniref:Alpha/beta hydrolase n=1 Tax=Shewanella inventionis TaxID=1738770 RepID=A0ABQ1IVS7_9GAMM|nr:alpha/beta hydrolase [Shewanella inventionis]MCL1158536.1 alpha/beta hydrolase [Shewanella inventionis]UAL44408.1 alpha/beta hydrolase [Shewanella inventionis]GGB52317.1 alpha/beta hydrolase [Shewanella inventionis]
MRGTVSAKLTDFLAQANSNIALAKQNNIQFTPSILRENLNKLSGLMSDSPAVTYIADKTLTLTDRSINVRVYSPAPNTALPVLVHFHGGGHMCGSVELYDPICRHLASIAQCVVISVEYRLAPEYPYPAGIDDCEYALIHYADLLDDVKYLPKVTIIGDSAGGAICTSLSMKSLTDKRINIDQQILIYPSVDYTLTSPSLDSNGTGFLLETTRIKWYFEQYFQSTDANIIKQASPLLGPMSAQLPKTLIFTAGCDPLRDEGIAYAKALTAVGVDVEHHSLDDMIHAYMLLHDLVKDECMKTYLYIAKFMAKV